MVEIVEGTLIADYKRGVEWRKEEGRVLFKTDSALEWFVRRHRTELVARGAMILRGGPGGSLVKVGFIDQVILEILSRESEEILRTKHG